MIRKIALIACLVPVALFAADIKRIPANSAVYITPMDGFENAVSAAILKKGVPIRVIDDKAKADYVLTGGNSVDKAGWAKTLFVSPLPAAHASVSLKDKDGTLIWAYSVDKSNAQKGEQSTAEAIAKHMKNEAVVAEEKK